MEDVFVSAGQLADFIVKVKLLLANEARLAEYIFCLFKSLLSKRKQFWYKRTPFQYSRLSKCWLTFLSISPYQKSCDSSYREQNKRREKVEVWQKGCCPCHLPYWACLFAAFVDEIIVQEDNAINWPACLKSKNGANTDQSYDCLNPCRVGAPSKYKPLNTMFSCEY